MKEIYSARHRRNEGKVYGTPRKKRKGPIIYPIAIIIVGLLVVFWLQR